MKYEFTFKKEKIKDIKNITFEYASFYTVGNLFHPSIKIAYLF